MESEAKEEAAEPKTKPIEGNDLFSLGEQMMSSESTQGSSVQDGRIKERTVIVLGEKGSGKSTVI